MLANRKSAAYWIEHLHLEPHPEGGYYRQTYRSDLQITPPGFIGPRAVSTAIYFLLEGEDFSALHRLRSDEMWHFYAGDPLLVQIIDENGNYSAIALGDDPDAGQSMQAVVKAGCWFGSSLMADGYAVVGCTVSPGFDFQDFEMAQRAELIAAYPQHRELIGKLTRS